MAEGGDSVDSGHKSRDSWRDNIPAISSLYLGSESVEQVLCREHSQEFKYFCKQSFVSRAEKWNVKTVKLL